MNFRCLAPSSSPSRSTFGKGALVFLDFFGRGDKKSLLAAVDDKGVSLTYDVDDRVITDIASPKEVKLCEPLSLAVGDALYVMRRNLVPGGRGCFEALTFGPSKDLLSGRPHWDWRCLQPPPFVSEPRYKATHIGGSDILVSTPCIGTNSFYTASGSWSKAGDWELPFYGHADFFPEYGAWLGFSAQDNRLCYSSELGASMQREPALDIVWDDPTPQVGCGDQNYPQSYTRILMSNLVHLGPGKFCVARLFQRVENELTEQGYIPQTETFIVVTGMVLKLSEVGQGIEMMPHKSLLYRIEGLGWVF